MRSPYGPHRKNYDWLGLTWNTEKGSLKGIERRVSTILACIDELNGKLPYMTARQLAGFVGRIISLIPVTWLPVMLLSSELDFRLWRFVSNIIGIRCSEFRVDSHINCFFWKKNFKSH